MEELLEKLAEFIDANDNVAWHERAQEFLAYTKDHEHENQFAEFMSWFDYDANGDLCVADSC